MLKGFGDPTPVVARLRRLAAEVRSAGIRVVSGRILGDESYFDTFRMGPGWKPHFFINESPPLSALTVDRGRYLGRTSRTLRRWPPRRCSARRSPRPACACAGPAPAGR